MRISDWSSDVCSSDLGGGGGAGFGSLAIARREGEADGSGKDERSQYGGSPAHGPAGPEAVKGNAGADPLACAIGSVDPAAGARGGDGTHSAFMGDAASLAVIARGDGRTGGRRGCRTLFGRLRREEQVARKITRLNSSH